MNLSAFIAFRYLRSKKSLNIINMVSYISLIGVVCGTAALIIVLSVFNGFENLTTTIYNNFDPELKITLKQGKAFEIDSAKYEQLSAIVGVRNVSHTLEDNVVLKRMGNQALARMKGVDNNYESTTEISNSMHLGSFKTHIEEYPSMVLGVSIASSLGLYDLRVQQSIVVTVPKRQGRVSLSNPASSLNEMEILSSGVFSIEQSFDNTYVFASLEFAQEILEREGHASAIEITLTNNADIDIVQKEVQKVVGVDMDVKTRKQQNEALYRMMKSEKLIVYAILLLIVVVLSFNISGSLSMLITEKKDDIITLQSMGADNKLIQRIFLTEGMLITFIGIFVGLLIGLTVCLMQQHFGLLKLPGNNLIIDAYPVKILLTDILIVVLSVSVIGYAASAIVSVRK